MQEKTTYMTTDELAARIKYDARTIRDQLKDSVLLEGKHYIRQGRWFDSSRAHHLSVFMDFLRETLLTYYL